MGQLQGLILLEFDSELMGAGISCLPCIHPILESFSKGMNVFPVTAVMFADVDAVPAISLCSHKHT